MHIRIYIYIYIYIYTFIHVESAQAHVLSETLPESGRYSSHGQQSGASIHRERSYLQGLIWQPITLGPFGSFQNLGVLIYMSQAIGLLL